MIVRVKLFAAARQFVGTDEIEVDVPDHCQIRDLRVALAEQYPALEGLLGHVLFAVNADYADDETPLTPEAEVACIPPVSGG